MGHGSCGAVKAVSGSPAVLPGNLAAIQHEMPGVYVFSDTRKQAGCDAATALADTVSYNADAQATAIRAESPALAAAEAAGTLMIVSAVYELESGLVTFHPAHTPSASPVAPPAATGPAEHGHGH